MKDRKYNGQIKRIRTKGQTMIYSLVFFSILLQNTTQKTKDRETELH